MPTSLLDHTTRPALSDRLLALWPDVAGKLGERRGAFLQAAWQRADQHGLAEPEAASRYVNLCFAFGPAFEQRPENEWALAILADQRLGNAVKLHQLVLRAGHELRRRQGDAPTLARADAALLDTLDGRRHEVDADAEPLPRSACDIDGAELRLLDRPWRHEYRKQDGVWQRLPGPPAPPALRVDGQHPLPPVLCVLAHERNAGPATQLQVRQLLHGRCHADRHPALRWLGSHGLERWRGAEARAVSFSVSTLAQPPNNGLGVALVEETSPEVGLLEAPSCGVRDDGVPLGALRAQVWAYPVHQWLFALQREAAPERRWPPGPDDTPRSQPPATRCRIERDGTALDAGAWVRGFDQALAQALSAGFDRLFAAWQQSAQNAAMRATPGLLTGRSAFTWGWREGSAGLDGPPLMRVCGDFDLGASLELQLEGDIDTGGARSHVVLSVHGQARGAVEVAREAAEPPLLAALLPVSLPFRFGFELALDPIAGDDGIVVSAAGPCSGAVEGVVGWRPRQSGGSGWEWHVRAAVEPVLAPITLHDPVLGLSRRSLMLLPAMPLVDWRLG